MRRHRFILMLLLLLGAQTLPAVSQTVYIAGGASYTPPVLPLRAATGCTIPQFSFAADQNAGLCLSAANRVFLQNNSSATASTSYLDLQGTSLSLNFRDAGSTLDSYVILSDDAATVSANALTHLYLDGTTGTTYFGSLGVVDRIAITPVAKGTTSFTGTFTSADLTGARTWTFPNAGGTVALSGQFTSADGSIIISGLDFTVDNSIFGRYTSGTTGAPASCAVGVTHFETDSLDFYFCGTTNTQVQLAEVAGNTFTGSHDFSGAELLAGSPIRLEGATNDNTYTTVVVTDPTSARNFTLPNADSVAVQPQTCSGTDKVSAVSSLGVVTCSADETGGAAGVPRPNSKRWARCAPGGNSATNVWTCLGTSSGTQAGNNIVFVAADATNGTFFKAESNPTTNSIALLGVGNNLDFWAGRNLHLQGYFKLGSTASERVAVGFHDDNDPTASADPALDGAYFRYVAGADTNWQCFTNDGAGGGTISDSGVAVSTTAVEFEIIETPSTNFVFKINGSTVCTNTTNLPTNGLQLSAYVRTLEDVLKGVFLGWLYVELDK